MSDAADSGSKLNASEFTLLQGARVLAALEAARDAAARAESAQRTAGAVVARQHAELGSVQEAGQRLSARSRDIRNSLQLMRESVDRAKLTALNTGLEGARLGEPVGKALVMMGDEVRNLLARAIDALEEHASLLAEVDRDRERVLTELAQISDGTRQISTSLALSSEQCQLTTALLGELRTDLGDVFGTDPEAARFLANSASQVRSLADSLLGLSQRTPLGVSALRELLGPLLSLVAVPGAADAERKR